MRTNRRKMMWQILPNMYERLKYVDNGEDSFGSNGVQYQVPFILTDIISSKDTIISLDIAIKYFKKDNYGYNMAGSYSPENNNIVYLIGTTYNKKIEFSYYNKDSTKVRLFTEGQYEDRKRIRITTDMSNSSLTVDFGNGNVERKFGPPASKIIVKKQISILTMTPYLPPFCRLYGSEIYQQNVLVCKLIPAKRKLDGVIGMYDVISGKFYTSPNKLAFIGE